MAVLARRRLHGILGLHGRLGGRLRRSPVPVERPLPNRRDRLRHALRFPSQPRGERVEVGVTVVSPLHDPVREAWPHDRERGARLAADPGPRRDPDRAYVMTREQRAERVVSLPRHRRPMKLRPLRAVDVVEPEVAVGEDVDRDAAPEAVHVEELDQREAHRAGRGGRTARSRRRRHGPRRPDDDDRGRRRRRELVHEGAQMLRDADLRLLAEVHAVRAVHARELEEPRLAARLRVGKALVVGRERGQHVGERPAVGHRLGEVQRGRDRIGPRRRAAPRVDGGIPQEQRHQARRPRAERGVEQRPELRVRELALDVRLSEGREPHALDAVERRHVLAADHLHHRELERSEQRARALLRRLVGRLAQRATHRARQVHRAHERAARIEHGELRDALGRVEEHLADERVRRKRLRPRRQRAELLDRLVAAAGAKAGREVLPLHPRLGASRRLGAGLGRPPAHLCVEDGRHARRALPAPVDVVSAREREQLRLLELLQVEHVREARDDLPPRRLQVAGGLLGAKTGGEIEDGVLDAEAVLLARLDARRQRRAVAPRDRLERAEAERRERDGAASSIGQRRGSLGRELEQVLRELVDGPDARTARAGHDREVRHADDARRSKPLLAGVDRGREVRPRLGQPAPHRDRLLRERARRDRVRQLAQLEAVADGGFVLAAQLLEPRVAARHERRHAREKVGPLDGDAGGLPARRASGLGRGRVVGIGERGREIVLVGEARQEVARAGERLRVDAHGRARLSAARQEKHLAAVERAPVRVSFARERLLEPEANGLALVLFARRARELSGRHADARAVAHDGEPAREPRLARAANEQLELLRADGAVVADEDEVIEHVLDRLRDVGRRRVELGLHLRVEPEPPDARRALRPLKPHVELVRRLLAERVPRSRGRAQDGLRRHALVDAQVRDLRPHACMIRGRVRSTRRRCRR